MNKNLLINISIVLLSGVIIGVMMRNLEVSGSNGDIYFLTQTLIIIGCNLIAYCLITLLGISKEKLLSNFSIVGVSLLGAFIYTIYNLIVVIQGDWWYISVHQSELYSRHIRPNIFFFCGFTTIFFCTQLLVKYSVILVTRFIKDNIK